jgi:hypothetical protein
MKNQLRKKLKPVVLITSKNSWYAPNTYAQNIILQAMNKGVTDPKKLKEIAGLRSIAEVYRTLDKMSIRKEYHKALTRQGISLDYIVSGIKGIAESSKSDAVRLKSFQALLRSLGVDKYEEGSEASKGWEEVLKEKVEEERKQISSERSDKPVVDEYIVDVPEQPEEEKAKDKEEEFLANKLYE